MNAQAGMSVGEYLLSEQKALGPSPALYDFFLSLSIKKKKEKRKEIQVSHKLYLNHISEVCFVL